MTDGIIGPEQPDLFMDPEEIDRLKFVVWQKENSKRYISIDLDNNAAAISSIDLYIYNYPAKGFSLPNLDLYGTGNAIVMNPPPESALEFDLINNNKLSQNDINALRKVTLQLRTFTNVTALLLKWNFTGLFNVQYFGLSELIVHCGEVLFPEYNMQSISFLTPEMYMTTIASNTTTPLTLTCTVSIQGSFEWHWKYRSVYVTDLPSTRLWKADGSRTSILNIQPMFCDNAGTYICEARFSGVTDVYSRMFNISIQSKQT